MDVPEETALLFCQKFKYGNPCRVSHRLGETGFVPAPVYSSYPSCFTTALMFAKIRTIPFFRKKPMKNILLSSVFILSILQLLFGLPLTKPLSFLISSNFHAGFPSGWDAPHLRNIPLQSPSGSSPIRRIITLFLSHR